MSMISLLVFFLSVIMSVQLFSPFLLSLVLVSMASSLAVYSWLVFSKWSGLVVALIFVGGMMIMFMYTASVSLQAKSFSKDWVLLMSVAFVLSSLMISLGAQTTCSMYPSSPLMMFSEMGGSILIFLVVYLLAVLIILVNIVESFKGALKKSAWL